MEERDYWVVSWDKQVLTLPGMRQAIAMRKKFTPIDPAAAQRKDEWHYYGTSAPPHRAGPAKLAGIIREHWQIENVLHYSKDYTQGEDRHVLRKGSAPCILSHLRSMVLGLLKAIDIPGLPAQTHPQKMSYLSGDVGRAVRALNGRIG